MEAIVKLHINAPHKRIILSPTSFWLAFLLLVPLSVAAQTATPRARVSLNADWRFQKGDPAGTEGQLTYEKIKPWVIATGNDFVMNPGARKPAGPTRPEGNHRGDVASAQAAFDDRNSRQCNLPHDWGIEGPFDQALCGGTGKLPWAGNGWYRKHFAVPVSDKGRQLDLGI